MTKQIFETNLWELSLLMLIRTLPIQEGGKGGIVGQMDWREANELVTLWPPPWGQLLSLSFQFSFFIHNFFSSNDPVIF